MKFARPLLIFLAILLALAGASLALVLSPSFQRWAVLRAVARQPAGLKFELAGIAAGFSHLTIQGLRVEQDGGTVQLGRLEADYALWPLVWQQRLELARVTADDLVIDASRMDRNEAGAATVAAPAMAPGILSRLKLPFSLVLTDCQVAGRLFLPGPAGQPALPVEFQVTGGKFAPEQEGRLLVTATVKNPQPTARVTQLKVQLNLRATQSNHRTFNQLALTAVTDAEGKGLTGQNQLKIVAQLTRQAAAERYVVSIDTLTSSRPENLLTLQAALENGATAYTGEWVLKARAAQLRPFLLGGALPEFSADGQGKFSISPAEAAFDCQGRLQGECSQLETIEPAWRAIGPVRINSEFDLAVAHEVASLRQLHVQLSGQAPVLEWHISSPVEFNLREQRLQVGKNHPGEVLKLAVLGLPLSWVRPFVQAADISGGAITGEWVLTADRDHLQLQTLQSLKISGLTVVQQGQLLLNQADLNADFTADLVERDFAATLTQLTLKTSDGDTLEIQGEIARPLIPEATLTASLSYRADLPQLLALWLPLGRLQAKGETNFQLQGTRFTLQNLATTVRAEQGAWLTVQTLQPFQTDLSTLTVATGAKVPVDLMKIELGQLALANLPLAGPRETIAGSLERGEFMLSLEADKLRLRALSPVKLVGLALSQLGQPMLEGLSVAASPRFELSPAAVRLQSGDIMVRTKTGTSFATLKAEADRTNVTGWRTNLTFTLEVPQLATQPMFRGAQAVSAGRVSGEIRGAWSDTRQIEARLTINGLVDRATGQTLPVANLSFQGVVQPNGSIAIKAPLLLDQAGYRSDLQVALDLVPAGPTFTLAGRLSGEQVELADVLALTHVFTSPATPPVPTVAVSPSQTVADTQAAWARINGQLTVDIKGIHRSEAWAMTGLRGQLTFEPARISLAGLEATLGGNGRLAAQGEVRFVAGAQPYLLAGKIAVTEFDAGKLFKAFDPTKPATLEGLFTVNGEASGRSETLPRLLERMHGQFTLTSRQGVFRGLQRTSSKISKTTKAVELGASVLGSLFGSDNVTKAAEKVAGTAYFVDQLAQELGELKYDQFSVRLTRDAALNLKLEDISLVSSEIRLLGQGTVTFVENKPLLEQPLTASLSLAARGKTEELLGKLRLLSGARDELGFAKTKEILSMAGTLTKPDPMAFFTRLATTKITDFLSSEN